MCFVTGSTWTWAIGNIAPTFKKRYRELQFVINNISNRALDFYSDFYIDGEQRKNRYVYEVVHDIDPQSPHYGLITVEKSVG